MVDSSSSSNSLANSAEKDNNLDTSSSSIHDLSKAKIVQAGHSNNSNDIEDNMARDSTSDQPTSSLPTITDSATATLEGSKNNASVINKGAFFTQYLPDFSHLTIPTSCAWMTILNNTWADDELVLKVLPYFGDEDKVI